MGVGWSRLHYGPLGLIQVMIGDLLGGFDSCPGDSATSVNRQFGVVLYDEDVTIRSDTQLLLLI